MNMGVIEALKWRYATKKFDPNKKLSEDYVNQIIESLRLTPTSYGLQLMKVVVVENPDLRQKLVASSYGQEQVKDASHLLILCRESEATEAQINQYIKTISETRNVPESNLDGYKTMMLNSILSMDNEKQNIWMDKQVYIALGNLMNTCAILEVDSCPMEGFVKSEYDQILELEKQGLKSVLAVPIGYRSEEDQNSKVAKVRRSTEDFVVKI